MMRNILIKMMLCILMFASQTLGCAMTTSTSSMPTIEDYWKIICSRIVQEQLELEQATKLQQDKLVEVGSGRISGIEADQILLHGKVLLLRWQELKEKTQQCQMMPMHSIQQTSQLNAQMRSIQHSSPHH